VHDLRHPRARAICRDSTGTTPRPPGMSNGRPQITIMVGALDKVIYLP
jgi:hypothetical protein